MMAAVALIEQEGGKSKERQSVKSVPRAEKRCYDDAVAPRLKKPVDRRDAE